MRHRPQDGRAQLVGLGQGGGLGGRRAQAAPFEGRADLGGEHLQQVAVIGGQRPALEHQDGVGEW